MRLKFIIPFFLFTSVQLNAQLITKKDVENFRWFTDNTNTTFYKSDTIRMARIVDQFPKYAVRNRDYLELEYNHKNNITTLAFRKHKKIEILDVDIKSWSVSKLKTKWKWKLNTAQQVLTFYSGGRLHSRFLVKEKINDVYTKIIDSDKNPREEIYHVLILKLVRLK